MICYCCNREVSEKVNQNQISRDIDQNKYVDLLNSNGDIIQVCLSCFFSGKNIFFCERCKKYFYEDLKMEDDLCRNCYFLSQLRFSIQDDSAVLQYMYKPTPIFFGSKPSNNVLTMGMQLELDNHDQDLSDNVNTFSNLINKNFNLKNTIPGYGFFYGKTDGSLSSCSGIQVVSHPATLDFHLETNYWKKMLETATRLGFKSNDCENCGIHIHCNRNYFSTLEIQKLDALINYHSRTFRRFARRNSRNYACYDVNKSVNRLGTCEDRYSALNLQNQNTIEWRIFKGNTRYESIMALFQLVQGVSDFIKQPHVTIQFIHDQQPYNVKKALKQYLENRNFKYLPAYTQMCKVWRDLQEGVVNQ